LIKITYQFTLSFLFAFSIPLLQAVESNNLLYNAEFEDPGYIYDWKASNCKASQVNNSKDVFSDKYSALFELRNGKKNAYIENKRPRIRAVNGETYELSIMAKGRGEIQMVCYQLGGTPIHLRGLPNAYSKTFKLNDKWQRFEYRHTFNTPDILEFSYRIILKGKNAKLYVDNAGLRQILKRRAAFNIAKTSLMGFPGQNISFDTTVEYSDKSCSKNLKVTSGKDVSPAYRNGKVSIKIPKNSKGKTYKIELFDPASGLGEQVFIEVFSKSEYNTIKQAAAKLSTPDNKINVLILGDSLSDLFRGQNYVDWLKFWSKKVNWINYGVRGDYIPRILSRLQGRRVWGMRRFGGIFNHKPDMVLVFCGHNDSRLTRRSNYKKMKVPTDKFKKNLVSLVKLLRGKYPRIKVILMTPAASNYEKSKQIWEQKGKRSDLFGKPEIMVEFQKAVKSVAKEKNCELIDLYTSTQKNPRNPELFQPDGVHFNSNGNYFAALQIIRTLANQGYWKNYKK
jgi:lysophospholipase L1-like esterase